jgi:hypothetical protein
VGKLPRRECLCWAVASGAMTTTEEKAAAFRAAAEAGDANAAREFGRLLCLVPIDPAEEARECSGHDWPAERWLRAALDVRPFDALAAVLLAGLLLTQIDHWQRRADFDLEADEDEVDEANARRIVEAEELYAGVVEHTHGAMDSALHRTALAGRAALAELSTEDGREAVADYAYYLVELDLWSGSVNSTERLVATDLEELRWACDAWLGSLYGDGSAVGLTLTVHEPGEEPREIDLTARFDENVDWDAVSVLPLRGALLPPGHPAGGWRNFYGYTAHVG